MDGASPASLPVLLLDDGRAPIWLVGLALLLALAMAAALVFGRYPLSLHDLTDYALAGAGLGKLAPDQLDLMRRLLWDIRLPRILAAVLIGAALASSGAAYQAAFVNPLVSPGILGVLAGASFGAALGMVYLKSWVLVQVASVAGGLAAVLLGLAIARVFDERSLIMLVLGGIFSGALFTGLLSLVKYLADPYQQLPAIVYWLMGSLSQVNLPTLAAYAPIMLVGIAGLALQGRALDALAMGEETATTLGVPVASVRTAVIVCATLVSAMTVAMAGMIGWIGLLAPHIARLLVGPLNRHLVPASALTGGILLLAADLLARGIGETELPIGVVTELVGLPVFLLVLRNARRGWAT